MRLAASLLVLFSCVLAAQGPFDGATDIGVHPKPGSHTAISPTHIQVTGGGANIWGTADAFHYAWKRATGDITLAAEVAFEGAGVDPHRKAVLMVRQTLEPGSPYVDVAIHGDGLTSMQYREVANGVTAETKFPISKATRFRLERRGDRVTVFAAVAGGEFVAVGPRLFPGPVYVGVGVSSHNADVLETATFSNVRLDLPKSYRSKLAIYDLTSKKSTIIFEQNGILEAPNWSRDGKHLLVNTFGDLYRIAPEPGAKLEKIQLGSGEYRCNNDHDYSRDGQWLAFSASTNEYRQSRVYAARADGSEIRVVTPTGPSYFHGWSPDGKWLAFVGQRDGKFELYRVPREGGPEERLTSARSYDDGPDYSPDGKWIYFNSQRSGNWDIWRIPASGGGVSDKLAERVTNDEWEDWFPHPSPDGKRMVLISFPKGTEGHNGRMPGMALRVAPMPGKNPQVQPQTLFTFFGGQGSFNVNSWAPDSRKFAYVIFEEIPQ